MEEPLATAVMLAAGGVLLVVAAMASQISQRLGVPALVVFLIVGMAAGSEGIGRIPFDDYELSFRFGAIALVLILFDGGLNTPMAAFRRVLRPAATLASVSVVLTAAIMTGIGVLLGLPVGIALLVGSVVSSTDAAAVFSVLRGSGVRLHGATGALLEVESGLNDPMAVMLTVLATEALLGTGGGGWWAAGYVFEEFFVGVLGGVLLGWAGRALLRRIHLPAAGLYPVLTVGVAFAAFGAPTLVDGSGFLAVYLAAMVLAAGSVPYRAGVQRVHDALAWLAQILMFLMLGLLVNPSQLLPAADEGFALALALAFVARPVAVLAVLWPFRFPWRHMLFISWVGLRGAVPIVLATYPVLRGVPHAREIFHLVFFVVAINSLLPGATVAWIARRLGVAQPTAGQPPASVELISLREYANEFVWYNIRAASAVAGAMVRDLPLPDGCVLTMVLRGPDVIAPRGSTQFADGDHVCAFVSRVDRPLLDLLFGRPEGGQEES